MKFDLGQTGDLFKELQKLKTLAESYGITFTRGDGSCEMTDATCVRYCNYHLDACKGAYDFRVGLRFVSDSDHTFDSLYFMLLVDSNRPADWQFCVRFYLNENRWGVSLTIFGENEPTQLRDLRIDFPNDTINGPGNKERCMRRLIEIFNASTSDEK